MVVGRVLPGREYVLLTTFLAIFAILGRPLGTLATAMNRYTSLLVSEGRASDVRRLLGKWVALLGVSSFVLSGICIVFAWEIASYFHLDRVAPIMVSALAIPALFLSPILGGTLQGLQRFGWVALSGIVRAVGRVVFGAIFTLFVYSACGWALAGHVGGLYLAIAVSFGVLMPLFLKKQKIGERKPLPSLRFYLLQCFVFQLAAGLLMTGDVIFVNHYLPEESDFAYAATLGRIVAFMAMSVAAAMFPKVVSEKTFSSEHRRLYLRSQLYTSGFVFLSLFICLLVPRFLLRFLYHIEDPAPDLIAYIRWMGVAMAFATLLNINLNLLLAQRRFVLLLSVLGCAVFYLVASYLWHETPYYIVGWSIIANFVALLVTTLGIVHPFAKPKEFAA